MNNKVSALSLIKSERRGGTGLILSLLRQTSERGSEALLISGGLSDLSGGVS